jgi:hypothetical protein
VEAPFKLRLDCCDGVRRSYGGCIIHDAAPTTSAPVHPFFRRAPRSQSRWGLNHTCRTAPARAGSLLLCTSHRGKVSPRRARGEGGARPQEGADKGQEAPDRGRRFWGLRASPPGTSIPAAARRPRTQLPTKEIARSWSAPGLEPVDYYSCAASPCLRFKAIHWTRPQPAAGGGGRGGHRRGGGAVGGALPAGYWAATHCHCLPLSRRGQRSRARPITALAAPYSR